MGVVRGVTTLIINFLQTGVIAHVSFTTPTIK